MMAKVARTNPAKIVRLRPGFPTVGLAASSDMSVPSRYSNGGMIITRSPKNEHMW